MTTLPLFSLIKELLIAIARAYPALVTLLVLSNVINDYNNTSAMFAVLVLITEFLNPFLKDISRAFMGDKTYPILGNGNRPPGAMNCGLYANGKKATSYGMPSGHAQIAVTFAAYIILTIFGVFGCPKTNQSNNVAPTHPACIIPCSSKSSSKDCFPFIIPYKYLSKNKKYIVSAILIVITIGIMYSRVALGCHTIQQVIVGALIGLLITVIFKMNEHKILKSN